MNCKQLFGKIFVLISIASFLGDRCDGGDLEKSARVLADQYILAEEFGLKDFLMEVNVSAKSTPDSEVLFTSQGTMTYFKNEMTSMSRVEWRPEIMDDLRTGFRRNEDMPFIFPTNQVALSLGEKSYLVKNDTLVSPESNPRSFLHFENTSTVPLPFDWPLHMFETFKRSGPHGLGKVMFEKKVCFLAREIDNEIESYWTVPGLSQAFIKAYFKDEQLVKFEMFWMPGKTLLENIDVDNKDHVRFISVGTKWKQFEDIDVPEEVNSIITSNPSSMSITYIVSAKLKFFGKDSTEYKKVGEVVDRLKKLPELKEPERKP